jgi:hypothetical protein
MPVIAAVIDVDEIAHLAIVKKPVVQIAGDAGSEKAQGNMN